MTDDKISRKVNVKSNEEKKLLSTDSENELFDNLIKTSTSIKDTLKRHPLEGMFQDKKMVDEYFKEKSETNIIPMPDDIQLETFILEYEYNSLKAKNDDSIHLLSDEELQSFAKYVRQPCIFRPLSPTSMLRCFCGRKTTLK